MSRESEFLDRLKQTFRAEAEEHHAVIVSALAELEKGNAGPERHAALIESVFREVHSLKGAARAVDMGDVERLCQSVEGIFSGLKKENRPPGKPLVDVLYRALDMMAVLERGTASLPREELAAILGQLSARVSSARDALAPAEQTSGAGSVRAAPVPMSETVRISAARLRSVFLQAEEMLSVKHAMARHAADLRALEDLQRSRDRPRQDDGPFKQKLAGMALVAAQESFHAGDLVDSLLSEIRTAFMMPFSSLLEIFPRMVRDLGAEDGKEAVWEVRGEDIQIDRRVLEEIKDPLVHIVRNSVSHGIETAGERRRLGKPGAGKVSLTVSRVESDKVELVMSDDGAGVDLTGVKGAATARGLYTAGSAASLDDKSTLELIFLSELSTSPLITDISGRGLGLAIAREKIEGVGGRIAVETARGQGTTFRILLPLSLATFRGVLVRSRGQTFVIPTASVDRALRVDRLAVVLLENQATVPVEGRPVALVRLGDLLGLDSLEDEEARGGSWAALVLHDSGTRVACIVDEILGEQEVLVKSLGRQLERVRNVTGATVLATGELVPILNPHDLLKTASLAPKAAPGGKPSGVRDAAMKSILLAEDSVTSRMLLQSILETAGFQVTTAVDGVEAFAALRVDAYDLLVSDIDMPRMNGFDLCKKVRGLARTADLPIVLVTTLDSREDRERGIDAGANAYIAKASFDQSNLLDVVKRLV